MKEQRLQDSPVTPISSEACVLGSMLLDRACIPSVRDILPDGTYFCLTEHGILYDELLAFNAVATVWEGAAFYTRLQERRVYDAVGGVDYLGRILDCTVSSATAVYHAGQVHRGHLAREAMRLAGDLRRQLSDGCDIAAQLEATRTQLNALAAGCEPSSGGLEAVTAATVTPQPLAWFWPNRIPAGMYSFIVGDPGAGKSLLSCYIAAIASNGGFWADGTAVGDAVDVLMFITEDNLARTVVPRLNAHCADLSRVHFCQGVTVAGQKQLFNIDENMNLLERRLDALPDCKLIVFDPVTGFMGDVNQNSQSEVRGVLGRICQLAEDRGVTILGLSHLNKKVDLDMRHRSIGSVAFNAVPRAVWGVFAQDETDDFQFSDFQSSILKTENEKLKIENGNLKISSRRRFFFPIKDNLCVEPTALEFTIAEGRVCFGKSLSAAELNAVLNPDKTLPPRLTKKEQAKQLILELLQSGPCESDKLIEQVVSKGITERTVREARRELRSAGKVDCEKLDGEGFSWFIKETP